MAKAKKPAAALVLAFAVQTRADDLIVGKTSEKGKKYLIQRDGVIVAGFQLYKGEIQIDAMAGALDLDTIGDIANDYYDWKDAEDRRRAREKRSAAKRDGETKTLVTVKRRQPARAAAQTQMVM